MTSITPLPDDVGTERLKRINRGVGGASAITEVAPYPNIHPARTSLNAQMAAGALSRRIHERPRLARNDSTRRITDRRKKQLQVLLDTRDHRERRRDERREESGADDDRKRGVDIYT